VQFGGCTCAALGGRLRSACAAPGCGFGRPVGALVMAGGANSCSLVVLESSRRKALGTR
jgi:hypothetical protein